MLMTLLATLEVLTPKVFGVVCYMLAQPCSLQNWLDLIPEGKEYHPQQQPRYTTPLSDPQRECERHAYPPSQEDPLEAYHPHQTCHIGAAGPNLRNMRDGRFRNPTPSRYWH